MNSRRKGHDFERFIARRLEPFWPGAKRGLSQARDGGEVPDVEGTPFWVECKRGRAPNIRAAMAQAIAAMPADAIPLIVTKADNEDVLVTMRLDDFLGRRWEAA